MKHRMRATIVAAVAAAVVVSGCGSSSSSSKSSSSSSSNGTAAEAGQVGLQSFVQKMETPPTSIGITAPITSPIPKDKTVDLVVCEIAACTTEANAFSDAASALGWKANVIRAAGTPASIVAAFTQVVQDHPWGVATTGFSITNYPQQYKQLVAAKIPIVGAFVPDSSKPSQGYTALYGNDQQGPLWTTEAKYVVGKEGKPVNILLLDIPELLETPADVAAFKSTTASACPKCTVSTLDIPIEQQGQNSAQVVNYLQGHSGINVVVGSVGSLVDGLPAALNGAGIKNVDIYSSSPDTSNLSDLKAGKEKAAIATPEIELCWQMMDAIVRTRAGQSTQPDDVIIGPVAWTPQTVPSTTSFPSLVSGYQQQFKDLWK